MRTLKYSAQQQAVIRSGARTLLVRAGAGAGKTTTLLGYAAARPDSKLLYIAFTQAVAEEAAQRFPQNVTCKTVNALAFAACGRPFKNKIGTNRAHAVSTRFDVPDGVAADAIRTVTAYCASADREFAEVHLPDHVRFSRGGQAALELAHKLWGAMRDTGDSGIKMTHDGYLKLYQLSRPRLDLEYDIIMVDEYQDTNDVCVALYSSQSCRRVYVGDPHQSIYAFRGATDAIDKTIVESTLHLTESYRYGPLVAHLATSLLAGYKGEKIALVGLNAAAAKEEGVDESQPCAILCRTNAGLFARAVDQLDQAPFHLVGGPEAYVFHKVLDIWSLKCGNLPVVRDPFIASRRSFTALLDYAKRVDDVEMRMLCGIVNDYGAMIPSLVSRIMNEALPTPDGARVILTTAHRSKGLEFDQVIINDDFRELVDEHGNMLDVSMDEELEQEVNLLYVALTRARLRVQLNPTLRDALAAVEKAGVIVPRPDSQSGALGDGAPYVEPRASVLAHKRAGSASSTFRATPRSSEVLSRAAVFRPGSAD